jgi:putative nucleotidyltransferase with HDIG domain
MQYKQEQILRSVNSIRKNKAAAGHDITHTLRVKDLCLYVAGIEGGDVELLEACALLHDIDRSEEIKNPGTDHAFISVQTGDCIHTKPYLFFVTFCHRVHRDVFSAPKSSLCALCDLCGSHIEFQITLAE